MMARSVGDALQGWSTNESKSVGVLSNNFILLFKISTTNIIDTIGLYTHILFSKHVEFDKIVT